MIRPFIIAALALVTFGCSPAVTPPRDDQSAIIAALDGNALAGKPLRYLIGADGSVACESNAVFEAPYGEKVVGECSKIAYGNLFDELNTGGYGPYLHSSDTAAQYGEGQIDPRGAGWRKNIAEQIARAKTYGFTIIEFDNPDAYGLADVIGAIDDAQRNGLQVVAKNPGLLEDGAVAYVAHKNVVGIIVEKGAGSAKGMDDLRRRAGKQDLPVWFVTFAKSGASAAAKIAAQIKAGNYRNMSVTHSTAGEYRDAVDVLLPLR